MSSNGVVAVSFDAGGTMIYCDPSPAEIYAFHLSRLGRSVNSDETAPVFRDAWAEMQRRTPPGIDRYNSVTGGEKAWWGAFVRLVLERLEHDAPWETLLDDLFEAFADTEVWKVFPETTTTIEDLARRGIKLAVISNWDRRLPDILHRLGLFGAFDIVTVSSIEGVEKPCPDIFLRTLDRLGVDPDAALHVGDSPLEDYDGARGAGLTAALIDRHGLFADQKYRRIASLDQILDLIA
jgi:putative hydrolase of the HAD superfamily